MAAPKKSAAKKGKVHENSGKEKYPSKKTMMAHEKGESKAMEKAEKKGFMAIIKRKKKK